ncbi:MAG: methyltransferase domain-containing protein [Anaerolineales bacterium]
MGRPTEQDFATVAEAFSLTAEKYDRFAEDHPHLTRLRSKVYEHLTRQLAPGGTILDLNCGTGIDAAHLANLGFSVHATDISPGMLARAEARKERLGLGEELTLQQCSFLELNKIEGGPYDAVFSNLGGLNCVSDLRPVVEQLASVVRPGGLVTWVLMPKICPWELALIFTGQLRLAFRRLSRHGTSAHLEGKVFRINYFSVAEVKRAFGSQFRELDREGLAVFTPTAESKNLARRFARLYGALAWLDDRVCRLWPFSGWGDFFIISFRYEPKE